MAGYSLTVWLVGVGALAPVTAWILNRLVVHNNEFIIANTDLAKWLLSGKGILFIVLSGAMLLMGLIVQVAGLIWIAREAQAGRLLNTRQALRKLIRTMPAILQFSFSAFALCLLMASPLIAGAGVIYLTFLSGHDINFYLTIKPPAWTHALIAAAIWGVLWLSGAMFLLLRWIYALPLWLDGPSRFVKALTTSWQLTHDQQRSNGVSWGLFALVCVLGQTIAEGTLYLIFGMVIATLGSNVNTLLGTLAAYLVLTGVLSLILSFLATGWGVCLLVAAYGELAISSQAGRSQIPRHQISTSNHPLNLRPWMIAMGILAFAIVSGSLTIYWLRAKPLKPAPLVIAHRAGAIHAPENTLAALEIAIRQGADYAEIDVQRSRDGTVVVIHDADLMKLAGDPRRVGQTDYQELAQVDIGRSFHGDFEGERLGRLIDFLEASRNKIKLMIELKYYGEDKLLAEETLRLVRNSAMEKQVSIMSLELAAVRQVQGLAPDWTIGYLSAVGLGNLKRLDVDYIAVSSSQATAKLINGAHTNGLAVYTWTVNDVDGMLDMMELGADGLITDDSAMAVKLIQDVADLTAVERLLLKFRHLWDLLPADVKIS